MKETFYYLYNSPIGIIKIGSAGNYINEVTFVEEPAIVEEKRSPDPLAQRCMDELTEYFNGDRNRFDLPVAQEGTLFQQAVWRELLTINYGKTISYLTLAMQLGNAKAIRAAASGNGKNKICIIIPCHRVIGSNHDLVGYVGGLWRKKWLLDHENRFANGVQKLF